MTIVVMFIKCFVLALLLKQVLYMTDTVKKEPGQLDQPGEERGEIQDGSHVNPALDWRLLLADV